MLLSTAVEICLWLTKHGGQHGCRQANKNDITQEQSLIAHQKQFVSVLYSLFVTLLS